MLRQHAARHAGRQLDLKSYREKRRQIIDGLITMHGDIEPLDATDPLKVLEEAADRRRQSRQRGLLVGLLAVASLLLTAALPSGQRTFAALSQGFSNANQDSISKQFLEEAQLLASSKHWESEEIMPMMRSWESLNSHQRYTLRRYQAYGNLIGNGSAKSHELTSLAEVSSRPEGLVRHSRRIIGLLDNVRRI
jgi:hypothetical protein